MKTANPAGHWFKFPVSLILSFLLSLNIMAQPPMPEAISISPEDASGTDTITLTLDVRKACISEKSLPFTGQETIYMSGAPILHWYSRTWWVNGIAHPGPGIDGTPGSMIYNGDSTYSIRFKPSAYFDITGDEIKGMSLAFADFDQQRQAFDNSPFGCSGFYIPLKTTPPVMDTISPGTILEIGGLFAENTVLDFDTIRIVNIVNVELGVTLTISPGTYVEFQDFYVINVLGTLIAEGTESDSIIFTAKDPATGWNGFWFMDQSDTDTSRFSYCQFKHMKTDHDWNGVINARYYPRLSISHSLISNNTAHAINLVNSNISLDHTTLTANSKGGVSSYASNASFLNCHIINNNNHGMYINLSNPLIVNSIIANNQHAAMELHAGDPILINSIVAKNGGLVMWMELSNPRFYNSIVWGNRHYLDVTDPTSSILFQNCIFPGTTDEFGVEIDIDFFGDNNFIAVDPMFINAPSDMGMSIQVLTADWTLPINSPAVNNGTLDIEGFEMPPVDLGGMERISYGIVDIGPHEFSQSSASITLDADITSDTILMADTVKVTGDIRVHNGVKLTIAPGTIVEFQGHYELIIEGCLIAQGSENHKIRFTIHDTAGYYDLDTTLGTWSGLYFQTWDNPNSVLDHCIFEYAADMDGGDRRGGAVFISDRSSPERITNCLFQHNYAEWQGGAVSVGWASTEILNNVFRYNLSNEGGAVYTSHTSSALIQDNFIHNNQAWAYGGGIYSSGATIIERNRVAYNNADTQGGGIYCRKSKARIMFNIIHNNRFGGLAVKNCDPFIASNLIVNNAADAGLGVWHIKREGAGIYIDINSDATIVNNTICNNLSSQYKGSSVRLLSDTRFINNIVWGNRDGFGNAAPIAIEGALNVDIVNCIVEGGIGSIRAENPEFSGTIDQILDSLPQFLKASSGVGTDFDGSEADWDINALSPAINNGMFNQEIFQDFYADYTGFERNPDAYDIGAYEHQTGLLDIFSQPMDIVACDGDTAVFDVMANDTAYYQWYRNEQIIEGAILPVLEINPVEQENEGIYFCRVWNAYGQKISEPSFLIVNHPPEIFIQPDRRWMIEGIPVVLEVRAEGSPPMSFQWFKDGTPLPDGEQPKVVFYTPDSTQEGLYHCIIENSCGMASTDSIQLFLTPQICMVTVDTTTGDNLVIWEKKSSAPIESYNVYRESIVAGQYEVLGNVPASGLSVYSDTGANPAVQAYIYKITALDAEGNESDINLCKPHKTIHLLTSLNTEHNVAQLDWDQYYGFAYGTYYIFRSGSKSGFSNVHAMASSTTTWTDLGATSGEEFYYRVAIQKPVPCSPTGNGLKAGTGPYHHSLSNMDDNKLKATGLHPQQKPGDMVIYPNPMAEQARVRFPNPGSQEHTFYLRDLSGKLVRCISGITTGEVVVDRDELTPGYYSIEISGPSVYRGKLIVK